MSDRHNQFPQRLWASNSAKPSTECAHATGEPVKGREDPRAGEDASIAKGWRIKVIRPPGLAAVCYVLTLIVLPALVVLPAPGQQPATVRVGTLKLVGGAPLFVAQERGFFRQEAIEIRFVYFGAAAPVATAVATGDVEAGATGITGTLFNLSSGGAKIWLVADRGQERPGYPLNAVVLSKAARDQGVRSLRDLKGKRIGLTTLGSLGLRKGLLGY